MESKLPFRNTLLAVALTGAVAMTTTASAQEGVPVITPENEAGTTSGVTVLPTTSKAPSNYTTNIWGEPIRTATGDCVISLAGAGDRMTSPADQRCEPESFAAFEPVSDAPLQVQDRQVQPGVIEPEAPPTQAQPFPAPEQAPSDDMRAQPMGQPVERERHRITLDADATFDFGSAELTDQGKRKLDDIVDASKDTENMQFQVTGYSDHLGDEQYNRDLSLRRAEAVKDYLVEQGIDEEIIRVAGRGEEGAVVMCEGLSGAQLIECLQPNRRIEVEFAAFESIDDGSDGME